MAEVGVVVPAHNPGPELSRALDSVRRQTFDNWQLVVVDDGSAVDLSWAAAIDPRIQLVRQVHAGVSVARNVGVGQLDTPLVAFLDQDDEWLPEKLRLQVDALAAEPDAPFCSIGFVWCWPDREQADGLPMTYERLASNGMVCLSSAMVRKDAYLAVGGHDPGLSQVGDFRLFLELCRLFGDPAHAAEAVVRYHYHGTNASGDYRRAHHERRLVLTEHLLLANRERDVVRANACRVGLARTDTLFAAQAYDGCRRAWNSGRFLDGMRDLAWSARKDLPATSRALAARLTRPNR